MVGRWPATKRQVELALPPALIPTLARPCPPMPIRCASALPAATTDNPAAATVTRIRFLHIECPLSLF